MESTTTRIDTVLRTQSVVGKPNSLTIPSSILSQFHHHSHKAGSKARSLHDTILYHLNSIWLFTVNDLKTIVGPSTAFAMLHKMGRASFNLKIEESTDSSSMIQTYFRSFLSILFVAAWTWINLLPFTIDNQRQPSSISEDACNKPWRPLPSNRMTPRQATILLLITYPVAVLISAIFGAHIQAIALIGFGIWYNDLHGADSSWLTRSFLNALGFICFNSGALQVLLGRFSTTPSFSSFKSTPNIFSPSNPILLSWLLINGAIVFTTIHVQDIYDQEGDALNNRQTIPLVFSDATARWTIAVPVLFWSVFCPAFWGLPLWAYIAPLAVGGLVAKRTLTKRDNVKEDKKTCKWWNLWLVVLYTLPMVKSWTL